MICFGLIGNPVSHSKSPQIYSEFFKQFPALDLEYRLFEPGGIEEVKTLVENMPELEGFNVTIPFKRSIISILDKLSGEVSELQSCNTVKIERNNMGIQLAGYNTDVYGFDQTLQKLNIDNAYSGRALVLGNGGSSQSVQYVLRQRNINYTIVSRRAGENCISYEQTDAELLAKHTLIINTTPLGMWPATEMAPKIPYEYLSALHTCIDLVYNPEVTQFMKEASDRGATVENGWYMLQKQAEKSWSVFSKNLQQKTE